MAKLTNEEIIASLKEMTILELNDLVKAIEEEFGVTAAAPVAVAAAAAPAEDALGVRAVLFHTLPLLLQLKMLLQLT